MARKAYLVELINGLLKNMEYDKDKVDEITLALLHLTTFKVGLGYSVWKGIDWETMNCLHEKGYISNPKVKEVGKYIRRSSRAF